MRRFVALLALVSLIPLSYALPYGWSSHHASADTPASDGLPFRVFVPGIACDDCEPAPTPPTPTPTSSPTPVATASPTPTPTVTATPAPAQSFTVTFLDVGQGDATLITVGSQRMLIDGGRSSTLVTERLQSIGVTDLDVIVATHPDADHVGGLAEILATFSVERIYVNGNPSQTQTYSGFLTAASNEPGATVTTATRGMTIPLGGLNLPVLHPASLSGDTNVDSVVIGLTCGELDVLFMGDAESQSEASMLAAGVLTDIDVLKVGHHGSTSSSSPAFVNAVKPEVGIISAGRTNQYGHPDQIIVTRFDLRGTQLLYTDTTAADDSVTMTSDCLYLLVLRHPRTTTRDRHTNPNPDQHSEPNRDARTTDPNPDPDPIGRLLPRIPHSVHPTRATRPQLQRHPISPLRRPPARPAPIRRQQRRHRL